MATVGCHFEFTHQFPTLKSKIILVRIPYRVLRFPGSGSCAGFCNSWIQIQCRILQIYSWIRIPCRVLKYISGSGYRARFCNIFPDPDPVQGCEISGSEYRARFCKIFVDPDPMQGSATYSWIRIPCRVL